MGLQTVKALLTERALARLAPGDYRFCPDTTCPIVYFSARGDCFDTGDLRVDVWQKRPDGARLLCYCFGETDASIRAEIESTGRSRAAERIRAHISAGRCACDLRNPRGTCCLGDVLAAVARTHASRLDAAGREQLRDSAGGAAVVDPVALGSDDGR